MSSDEESEPPRILYDPNREFVSRTQRDAVVAVPWKRHQHARGAPKACFLCQYDPSHPSCASFHEMFRDLFNKKTNTESLWTQMSTLYERTIVANSDVFGGTLPPMDADAFREHFEEHRFETVARARLASYCPAFRRL